MYKCVLVLYSPMNVCMSSNTCSAGDEGCFDTHSFYLARLCQDGICQKVVRATPLQYLESDNQLHRMSHGDFSYMFRYVLCLC